jgi:hypothetical protein
MYTSVNHDHDICKLCSFLMCTHTVYLNVNSSCSSLQKEALKMETRLLKHVGVSHSIHVNNLVHLLVDI